MNIRILVGLVLVAALARPVSAQQWPTYRGDHARSGIADQVLAADRLQLRWAWQSPVYPDPAWDGPARWDAYNRIRDLPAMRQYDACFHPVSDGQSVYFGSSSQDSVYAIELTTGKSKWQYTAGGPVRLAPTLDGDRILFGCDDGFAYCLDRNTGTLLWRFSPAEHLGIEGRQLLNNDRLISYYPVRTGVAVRDGIAYFGASLLPWRESLLVAIDSKTGQLGFESGTYVTRHDGATLEGSLLVTSDRLIVPQGRVAPLLFDRQSGAGEGSLPGGGGVTTILTDTGQIVRAEGGTAARTGQVGVFQGKERVASFPRGRAMVVGPQDYFVIDGEKLFAASRADNELKWIREVDEPLELIQSGDVIFVGGRDHVTAVSASDGRVVWSAKTSGRVFGLAVAGGCLLAATDQGALHVFEQSEAVIASHDPQAVQPDVARESPPVKRVREKSLLHRWVFHRSSMSGPDQQPVTATQFSCVQVRDQAGRRPLKLQGQAKSITTGVEGGLEAVQLNGDFLVDVDEPGSAPPTDVLTVAAWVRIDQTQPWGNVVGQFRDDGAVEHGWLLGYRSNRFCFGVAGGEAGLTYLSAESDFVEGRWYHVAGVYNGLEMRLYVNGELAASSQSEQGPISYGETNFFTVGCYRDTDESFPLVGALHEVRIYATALEATDIRHGFDSLATQLVSGSDSLADADKWLRSGPMARYLGSGAVEVTFETDRPATVVLDLILENGVRRVPVTSNGSQHQVVLDDLPFRRQLQYQIRDVSQQEERISPGFSLDTHFDWGGVAKVAPSPTIESLIDAAPNPRGIALVIGSDLQSTAESIARSTGMSVVLVVEDAAKLEAVRRHWQASEFEYGRRQSATDRELNRLPAATATMVVARQDTPEVRRLVRPQGGILTDGAAVVWTRDPIEGAGVWSHMYGTADNSAYGGEHLGGASSREDLVTQWIGRPGPRYQTDRQNRKPSPLAAGGRLFLQGQQRLIGMDSYSGAILWSLETPTVMRWNVPHDCSNWCADDFGLFVAAEDRVLVIDGKTGRMSNQIKLPSELSDSPGSAWGYLARHKNQLLGTRVDASAIYTKWWGSSQWFDSTGGEDTHVVTGDSLFAVDHQTGTTTWIHSGLILHPTITVLDDHVYFLEARKSPQPVSSQRLSIDQDRQLDLVCLNMMHGDELWREPLAPFAGHLSSLYLAGGGEGELRSLVMVASEATLQKFAIETRDPKTGAIRWQRTVDWEANHHGKHISRPAIQGDLVYVRPEAIELADGMTLHRGFPGGHGCSSYTACANGIFSRLGETTWWDARTDKVARFNRIRTDCWVSVIPAQGMLLSAEGGGGCSCGSWLETSLGFLPRSVDQDYSGK